MPSSTSYYLNDAGKHLTDMQAGRRAEREPLTGWPQTTSFWVAKVSQCNLPSCMTFLPDTGRSTNETWLDARWDWLTGTGSVDLLICSTPEGLMQERSYHTPSHRPSLPRSVGLDQGQDGGNDIGSVSGTRHGEIWKYSVPRLLPSVSPGCGLVVIYDLCQCVTETAETFIESRVKGN